MRKQQNKEKAQAQEKDIPPRGPDKAPRKSKLGTQLAPQGTHPLYYQMVYIEPLSLLLPAMHQRGITQERQQLFLIAYCPLHGLVPQQVAHPHTGKVGYLLKINNTPHAYDNIERQARRYGYVIRKSSRMG